MKRSYRLKLNLEIGGAKRSNFFFSPACLSSRPASRAINRMHPGLGQLYSVIAASCQWSFMLCFPSLYHCVLALTSTSEDEEWHDPKKACYNSRIVVAIDACTKKGLFFFWRARDDWRKQPRLGDKINNNREK